MAVSYLSSPIGTIEITGDYDGVSQISFLDQAAENIGNIPEPLEICQNQLMKYFAGERKDFDFKIDIKGTDFQQEVWTQLMQIPYGNTCSYQQLSQKIGDVKAIRAVAAANGKNPLSIVVPCHRVIGKNGDLVGYAGGLHRKKWLLEHENPSNQISLFK